MRNMIEIVFLFTSFVFSSHFCANVHDDDVYRDITYLSHGLQSLKWSLQGLEKDLEKKDEMIHNLKTKLLVKDRKLQQLLALANAVTSKFKYHQRARRDLNPDDPEVGFTANLGHHLTNLGYYHPIIFEHVQTNIGGAYDNVTGFFIAPVSGTYQFFCTILSERYDHIETEIVKNGNDQLAEMYSGGKDKHGSAANFVIARLRKGDHVSVRVHGQWSANFAIHGGFSTFSGYLLHATFDQNQIIG